MVELPLLDRFIGSRLLTSYNRCRREPQSVHQNRFIGLLACCDQIKNLTKHRLDLLLDHAVISRKQFPHGSQ